MTAADPLAGIDRRGVDPAAYLRDRADVCTTFRQRDSGCRSLGGAFGGERWFFTVAASRLPGSRRFMAPEEFRRGAVVDQRTTVFNLGRTAQVLLDAGDLDGRLRAGVAPAAVAGRATSDVPAGRHPSVDAFAAEWRDAGVAGGGRRRNPADAASHPSDLHTPRRPGVCERMGGVRAGRGVIARTR